MKDWKKEFTQNEMSILEGRYHAKVERTKKRGIGFSLTLDDWFMMGKKLLGMGACDYTNMPFHMGTAAGYNPKYPSVERIDDKKGYVRGNVCVVMRRANELKDFLVDKKTAITIIEPLDRDIVQAMMLNMSRDHMEILKTKYIPQEEETNMNETKPTMTVEVKSEAKKEEVKTAVKSEVIVAGDAVDPVKLPEDVAVAIAYAGYCKNFSEVGMSVSVTYSQFKARYMRGTCAMSGEKLPEEPKAILILDLQLGFAKDNFLIVSRKMETAMTNLMISTGMSLPKVAAMLQKVVA